LAEAIAQSLRFVDPQFAEPGPQRHHELHLVAMRHHALSQFMQLGGVGGKPVFRNGVAGAPVGAGELVGDVGESDALQRPALRRLGGVAECALEPFARRRGDRIGFRAGAQLLEPRPDGRAGTLGQARIRGQVRERIERRTHVAGAGQRAGEMAGLVVQGDAAFAQEGLEQAQHRPPALHGLAEIVHHGGVGQIRIAERLDGLAEDVVRHAAQHFGTGRKPGSVVFRCHGRPMAP